MKIENNIGWCDETTNAVTGCDKVSPGCKNCYAQVGTRARVLRAQGIETWGVGGSRMPVAGMPEKLRRLNKYCVCDKCHAAGAIGRMRNGELIAPGNLCTVNGCTGTLRRIRLFADSNSDWLDDKWSSATLASFLNEIRLAPNVDVLLLTKRTENFGQRINVALGELSFQNPGDGPYLDEAINFEQWLIDWLSGSAPANVWLGTSVESQKYADERIPLLLQIPAAVRFLSCEPLLEALRFTARSPFHIYEHSGKPCCVERNGFHAYSHNESKNGGIDWVIVGGESGKDRRDCGVEAIVSVAEQCAAAGVPVYVKQDCAFKSGEQGRIPAEVWARKEFPKTTKGDVLATDCTDERGLFNEESRNE
jgi:protein gp37